MSIAQNEKRVGNFTSSEITALRSEPTAAAKKEGAVFGKAAITYISKKNKERRLGRSVDSESNAKPLVWGKTLEPLVFDKLGLEYVLTSQETDMHPKYDFWSGSKDAIKYDEGKTVADIKCPITLSSFCDLVDGLYNGCESPIQYLRDNHTDGEKFYDQLVSNAIINDCRFAELIVYCPYESELEEIRLLCDGKPNCYWISMSDNSELPFIKDGGYYKNINIIRFEVTDEEKKSLTDRAVKAAKLLIKSPIRNNRRI